MKKRKKQIVNKKDAIDILFDTINVSNWDHETMVMYIEEKLYETFDKLNIEELNDELKEEWGNRYDDECPYIVDDSPTAKVLYGK